MREVSAPRLIGQMGDADMTLAATGRRMFYNYLGKWQAFPDGIYHPRAFGASGSDWTARFLAALTEANATAGTLIVPDATCNVTAQLTADGVDIVGETPNARIVSSALGVGTSALKITKTGSSRQPTLQNFTVNGSGTYSLGNRNADCDGLEIHGQAKPLLINVSVNRFDNGFVFNNDVGHIFLYGCNAGNNYYGLFIKKDTFDYLLDGCVISGNNFANIAIDGDIGLVGMVIRSTHLGFSPYGIYQGANTSGTETVFIVNSVIDARFESCGNAAMYTELEGNSDVRGWVGNLDFVAPAHTWNASYKIAGRDDNYACVWGALQNDVYIDSRDAPFLKGDLGTFRFKHFGYNADDVTLTLVGSSWTDDGTLVTGAVGVPRYYLYNSKSNVGIVRRNLYKTFGVGTSDSVSPPAAKGFMGWLCYVDSHVEFDQWVVERIGGSGSSAKLRVYDASDGLTDMPLIYGQSVNVAPTAGVYTGAMTSTCELNPGVYVIGISLDVVGVTMAGASALNRAQVAGAVSATTNAYDTAPSTLTVTPTTTALNLTLSHS